MLYKPTSILILPLYTLSNLNAQEQNSNNNNNNINPNLISKNRGLRAGHLFGQIKCSEPDKRFESSVANKITHNSDVRLEPEKWHCQFCDADLFNLVHNICCGQKSRAKREAEDMAFWQGITYQEHEQKKMSLRFEEEHHDEHTRKVEKMLSELHDRDPKKLWYHQKHEDCVDDINYKGGETSHHRMKRQSVNDDDEEQAGVRAGKNRGTRQQLKQQRREERQNQNNENNQAAQQDVGEAKWHRSIRKGGKGRSTYSEVQPHMLCHKEIAAQMLSARSMGGTWAGSTPNRAKWKHTYIQHECCGMADNKIWDGYRHAAKNSCNLEEISQMNLQEECCHEGCRVEEIYEGCGAWRWDMKENFEEERKTQTWRPEFQQSERDNMNVGGQNIFGFRK